MKKRTQVCFTQTQIKKLNEEADKLGSSMASIVRRAVNDYFSNNIGGLN